MEVDSPSPREKADIPVQHDPAEAHAAAEGSTTVETITQGTGDTTARPWPPANVRAWRFVPSDIGFLDGHARSLWDPLESFFEEQGYCLFVLESQQFDVPKNPTEIRTPDPYHVFIGEPLPSRFRCIRNKLCAATRLSDGTHVVLQLLAIGEDGLEEVEILRRLHERPISTEYRNRAVPLLQMIKYEQEKMVFGVFPLLGHRRKLPKHRYPKETLETCLQWMEALAYLHSNLVAHLDIGPDEFLINYAGPVDDPRFADTSDWNDLAYDFYCHFSQQCYITDFEISVKFDSRSDPAERLVVGLGGGKVSGEMRRYPKMLGPEVWMPENEGRPYCPFRHDVYQLGKTMQWEFPGLARAYPAFDTTIKAMVDVKPENRPNMSQVMHSMKTFLTSLTDQDLQVNGYQTGTAGSWLPQHKAFFEGFGDWMHR